MIYLDEEQVRSVLHWDALIAAMEAALAQFSAGATQQPVRTILEVEPQRRFFGVMPAVAGDVMGLKAVSFYPANRERNIPTHHATILLFDARTGEPLAAMDGRLITEMRTAAVSAAVTRRLMPEGSRTLALLGSGVQARAHLEVLRHLHPFDDVRVWSPTAEHAQAFAAAHEARATDAQTAVRGADVVVVATMAQEPVLQGAWLRPGAHVNAVGGVHPQWRELDDDAMANALIVDSRAAARIESGDVIGSRAAIAAEAGELFSGAVTIARTTTTVFKSLGLAVEDVAAAKLVYDSIVAR
jgi:ornithine cyclodeaminase/alanine dehydrogenase-like protein (mu-crystallin family)